jgi:hypothetical protein
LTAFAHFFPVSLGLVGAKDGMERGDLVVFGVTNLFSHLECFFSGIVVAAAATITHSLAVM